MNVVITGANGFVGKALTKRLLSVGEIKGKLFKKIILIDQQFDEDFIELCSKSNFEVSAHSGDISKASWLREILDYQVLDIVFHLASIPGGMAEQNEDLARRVNIGATETLLDIGKAQSVSSKPPVFIFASSIAVFGKLPDKVTDQTLLNPQLSYGAHKVIGEVLVNDFSRRGWVDGRSLRLPGVLARPPAKTGQLSAFLSDIIRDVSQGKAFTCPMSPSATTWASSLPNIVDNLLHAAIITSEQVGEIRTFTLPTLCFTMKEMAQAIGRVYGQNTEQLVDYQPEPLIETLFGSFPSLETSRADLLGFKHDGSIDVLVERALTEG
ncbi:NAD-dependent epimerase/dehydratase family protein [Cycloclasticus pugetii]|uniref:NAD-dependent epimerase/dehydratase family protein n=1 Tax=Cycloclasticus pugetii TaxID=34068 RepID=UPI003A929EA7